MPKNFNSELIRDSKKLTEKQRKDAYKLIMENAIEVVCEAVSATIINKIGINPATFKAMHLCLDKLTKKPEHILVDGTVWEHYSNTPVTTVPKGDDTYTSIAAAAIVAKVKRDEYMGKIHELYPQYDWNNNKGYLSAKHIAAIKKDGPCRYHRTQYIKKIISN